MSFFFAEFVQFFLTDGDVIGQAMLDADADADADDIEKDPNDILGHPSNDARVAFDFEDVVGVVIDVSLCNVGPPSAAAALTTISLETLIGHFVGDGAND